MNIIDLIKLEMDRKRIRDRELISMKHACLILLDRTDLTREIKQQINSYLRGMSNVKRK